MPSQPAFRRKTGFPERVILTGPTEAPGVQSGRCGLDCVDAALLAKVREDLAVYIGPMAKVIVNRAARQAQSIQ